MKKPMLHVTESDIKDVLAACDGYVGSYSMEETTGRPVYYKNFGSLSVDEIKEEMCKRMNDAAHHTPAMFLAYENLFTTDGKPLSNNYAQSREKYENIVFDENSSLDLSDKGLGFRGKFHVYMKDGSRKDMDLIVAPLYSTDVNDICQKIDEASREGEETGTGRYFLDKYGDKSIDDPVDRAMDAYDNIPDNVKDMLDAIDGNPMGLDWDDIKPHEPQMVKTKSETKDQTLDESLCSETEATKEKQMGE